MVKRINSCYFFTFFLSRQYYFLFDDAKLRRESAITCHLVKKSDIF